MEAPVFFNKMQIGERLKNKIAKICKEAHKRSNVSETVRAQMSNYAKRRTPEHVQNLRLAAQARGARPEERVKRSEAAKRQMKKVEMRQNLRLAQKKVWAQPGYRERMSKIQKEVWTRPEVRKKNSECQKALWLDPKFRKKMMKVLRNPERIAKLKASLKANLHGPYRESTVERAVVNWARSCNILVFKTNSMHGIGAPDRIFLIPGGKPLFVEFKRGDGQGKLSKIQQYNIQKMQEAGYDVIVECNKENCITAIKARVTQALDAAKRAVESSGTSTGKRSRWNLGRAGSR
jgi:hypothetical protein